MLWRLRQLWNLRMMDNKKSIEFKENRKFYGTRPPFNPTFLGLTGTMTRDALNFLTGVRTIKEYLTHEMVQWHWVTPATPPRRAHGLICHRAALWSRLLPEIFFSSWNGQKITALPTFFLMAVLNGENQSDHCHWSRWMFYLIYAFLFRVRRGNTLGL